MPVRPDATSPGPVRPDQFARTSSPGCQLVRTSSPGSCLTTHALTQPCFVLALDQKCDSKLAQFCTRGGYPSKPLNYASQRRCPKSTPYAIQLPPARYTCATPSRTCDTRISPIAYLPRSSLMRLFLSLHSRVSPRTSPNAILATRLCLLCTTAGPWKCRWKMPWGEYAWGHLQNKRHHIVACQSLLRLQVLEEFRN